MTDHASLRAALAGGAEFDDMTIITVRMGDLRALLADYDRMRDALCWTAAALQESCRAAVPITEGDLFFVGADVRTAAEILNAADAALAQKGS